MQLSLNFPLSEFVKSDKAVELGLDNTPRQDAVNNLILLCQNILQPVRDHFGAAMLIQSGYRSRLVNKAVGGSPTSDHVYGKASDIEVVGVSNLELANYISAHFRFKQLILEFHRKEIPESGWVHVSYDKSDLRCEILTAVKVARKTQYLPGLVTS